MWRFASASVGQDMGVFKRTTAWREKGEKRGKARQRDTLQQDI